MEHEIRRKILLRLIHKPGQTFNELWNKEGQSNKFAYHLKRLESDDFIVVETEYCLEEGTITNHSENIIERIKK